MQPKQANQPVMPTIVISLTPTGVRAQFAGVLNRPMANQMLATATQDIVNHFLGLEERATLAAAEGPKPVIAPPGLQVERNPLA